MSIPDDQIRPQDSDGQTVIWVTLSIFMAVVLLALTCGGGLMWLFGDVMTLGGVTKTETSFATDVERRVFVGKFSPVAIPKSATAFKIQYNSFQDTYMKAEFTLVGTDFDALFGTVQVAAGGDPGMESFELTGVSKGNDYVNFTFNRETAIVTIVYVDP